MTANNQLNFSTGRGDRELNRPATDAAARATWTATVLKNFLKVQRVSKSATTLAQSKTRQNFQRRGRTRSVLDCGSPLPLFKSWQPFVAVLCLLAALFTQTATLHAQPAAPANRVLELDGKGSYVQLPPNVFNELTEATVEAWVKWETVGNWTRVFGYGDDGHSLMVGNREDGSSVTFQLYPDDHTIVVEDGLRPKQWLHIAAVCGPQGMQLFLNGVLVGTNSFAGSFKSAGSGRFHFLGRSEWGEWGADNNDHFKGQMDEVRVWKVARTAEQIRETLFQTLTGKEPGLAGYWNFDDGGANGVVKDLSGGGHDGKLMGKARAAVGRPPTAEEWKQQRATISGIVKDETGQPMPGTAIVLKLGGFELARTTTDAAGRYTLSIDPNLTVDLSARNDKRVARVADIKLQPSEARTLDLAFSASTGSLALDLDGKESYLELPSEVVNQLTEATVEAWVKRDAKSRGERFFSFGQQMHDVGIEARGNGTFRFFLQDAKAGTQDLQQSSGQNNNAWVYVAAVSGPQGMKLFVNGTLVASSDAVGSFAAVKSNGDLRIGRSVVGFEPSFAGQIDEVRIWNHARTSEQIRGNLFTTLTGKEPGLVGYWNFDDGKATDSLPASTTVNSSATSSSRPRLANIRSSPAR
ncbi:MAG: carboxypeptidase regulatory-like domain-containing protein [Verrucomicrobia bacterium]|nr:carboxypeptidase regulatory-like domain-containing protein [Verrucomicrobiota bacterium]